MRKLIFATLFVGSVCAVSAQGNIKKGDWMLGGDAGFSSQKQGDYKTTSFSLAPDAGYFFINNFAGGLRANVSSSKYSLGTSDDTKNTGYELAPFVRYYFLPAAQKVNLFADASFGFGQNKYESVTTQKTNFTNLGIKAGPAIFITPATALEIALGYNTTKVKDVEDRENTFGVSFGFQIHIPGTIKK